MNCILFLVHERTRIFSECPGRGAWPRNALGAPQKTRQHKFRIQMQRELELANQFYNGPRRIRGFHFVGCLVRLIDLASLDEGTTLWFVQYFP